MDEHAEAGIVLFGGFRFDRGRGLLARQNDDGNLVPVAIGSRALDILALLIDRHGQVVSRDEILNTVWPAVVENANVTVQISALRRVIDEGRSDGSLIQTVSGRGYRFVATVAPSVAEVPSAPSPIDGGTQKPFTSNQPLLLPDKPSIAVLPFATLSGDPPQEYFADGIVEEITTALSRIRWLSVVARNSSFTYNGQAVDVKQIGRELGVRYVLEGSVRKAGGRVRIAAQLIDAISGAHLWADRFDGLLQDVFELQDRVASNVAGVVAT